MYTCVTPGNEKVCILYDAVLMQDNGVVLSAEKGN